MNKGIETLQVATQEYPLQVENFINIGTFYLANGDVEKSAAANDRALQLQPENAIALENGVGLSSALDKPAEAQKHIATANRLGLNGTSLLGIELGFYVTQGDWTNVQKIIADTAGRPDVFIITSSWAGFLPELGRIQLARATQLRAADQAASAKQQDAQAGALLFASNAGWMVDKCVDPEKTVKHALQLDKGKVTLIAAANTLALCNQAKPAEKMLADLEKRFPEDTLVQELNVPQSRAFLALKAGDPQRALTLLERVRPHDLASFAAYLRGLAYLQLKDPRNAIASFQDATRLKGTAYNVGSPYGLAFLGLGRAYVMAGDKAAAKKAYDVFFTEWKSADADLPVLAEAKKEYAQL